MLHYFVVVLKVITTHFGWTQKLIVVSRELKELNRTQRLVLALSSLSSPLVVAQRLQRAVLLVGHGVRRERAQVPRPRRAQRQAATQLGERWI